MSPFLEGLLSHSVLLRLSVLVEVWPQSLWILLVRRCEAQLKDTLVETHCDSLTALVNIATTWAGVVRWGLSVIATLPILQADEWQVCVLADLLIEPQRLFQGSLFICFILDLLGALQQLISLSGRQTRHNQYWDTLINDACWLVESPKNYNSPEAVIKTHLTTAWTF